MDYVPLAFQCIYGWRDEGSGNGKEGREWLPGLLYADDLVLCGESEEHRRTIVGQFVELCRRGLKVNAGKSKLMVLNGEEGLELEVNAVEIRLEHVSEFKYLG